MVILLNEKLVNKEQIKNLSRVCMVYIYIPYSRLLLPTSVRGIFVGVQ